MINPNHLNTISMILDEVKVTHFNTISSLNQHLLTSSDSNPNQIYKLITEITKLEVLINQLENILKLLENH